ncbi:PREDICTED: leucine-rich repeat-containing protein C10orf11 homolog [Branchiostoma belcheri]|uniref:Leucine-rich repeat-containing protein C10orf11 homolog n=1 Tax=Branchiostoma belcheri TaxID=7741 RepID=A0A6P4YV98_BRABE|nr:PREDICTED: leucine-rich repeat-containing protein C10orf11 homolog [Branchiostoma belcheri]
MFPSLVFGDGAVSQISLAYNELTEIPADFHKHQDSLEILDLSHNKISSLMPLMDFRRLNTLILDSNGLTSHVKFPPLPSLHTLWVNHNNITNLSVFIETVAKCFPNLRFLSMMNNEAAPSYFNGGTVPQYLDYRQYVISRLPKLETLDDRPISKDQREEAERIYGRRQSEDNKAKKKRPSRKKPTQRSSESGR